MEPADEARDCVKGRGFDESKRNLIRSAAAGVAGLLAAVPLARAQVGSPPEASVISERSMTGTT